MHAMFGQDVTFFGVASCRAVCDVGQLAALANLGHGRDATDKYMKADEAVIHICFQKAYHITLETW